MVPKHARRLTGFDEAVVSLYAKGMTTGDIAAHLQDVYGATVSRDLVSRVTDAVVEEMTAWQARPLEPVYPVLLIDAIYLRVRDGQVANRPVYVAMGITVEGVRDVLGFWMGPTGGEGARHWLTMLTELKNRGVKDVLIACCDGLKGLPDALSAVWPAVTVQSCVVHLVRNSLRYVPKQHWARHQEGQQRAQGGLHQPQHRGRRGPVRRVRRHLAAEVPRPDRDVGAGLGRVRPVPRLPRRDQEADLHHQRDRVTQRPVPSGRPAAGHFPTEQAALKILYLTVRERRSNRTNPTGRVNGSKAILNVLAITCGERLNIN